MRECEINKQKADSRRSWSPTRNKDISLKLCFLLGITIFARSEISIEKLKLSAVNHLDAVIIFKFKTFCIVLSQLSKLFPLKKYICYVSALCGNTWQWTTLFPSNQDPGKMCNIEKIAVWCSCTEFWPWISLIRHDRPYISINGWISNMWWTLIIYPSIWFSKIREKTLPNYHHLIMTATPPQQPCVKLITISPGHTTRLTENIVNKCLIYQIWGKVLHHILQQCIKGVVAGSETIMIVCEYETWLISSVGGWDS